MKSQSLFVMLLLASATKYSFSQDTIYLKNGMQLPAKILEIFPETIKYKLQDQEDSVSYIISHDSIESVKFSNGKIELFEKKIFATNILNISDDPHTIYLKGKEDAKLYYRANGPFWVTFTATSPAGYIATGPFTIVPIAGIATGITFSVTKPNKIITPDINLLNNPDYVKGYTDQAKKKRLGSAVGGFFLGLGVDAMLVLIVLSNADWH